MQERRVLALDLGTSSVRALLVSGQPNHRQGAHAGVHPVHGGPSGQHRAGPVALLLHGVQQGRGQGDRAACSNRFDQLLAQVIRPGDDSRGWPCAGWTGHR